VDEAELRLIEEIAEGSPRAFERFFKTYFKSLYRYAFTMLQDEVIAEEAVQDVFYKIWERHELLAIHTSLKAFLYKSVYHQCLNQMKQQKRKTENEEELRYLNRERQSDDHAATRVQVSELQLQLQLAMNALPEQCRTIFYMSRFDELKYREIAERMDLSIKTVEAQMTKALKILREKLVDFLPLLLWILLNEWK